MKPRSLCRTRFSQTAASSAELSPSQKPRATRAARGSQGRKRPRRATKQRANPCDELRAEAEPREEVERRTAGAKRGKGAAHSAASGPLWRIDNAAMQSSGLAPGWHRASAPIPPRARFKQASHRAGFVSRPFSSASNWPATGRGKSPCAIGAMKTSRKGLDPGHTGNNTKLINSVNQFVIIKFAKGAAWHRPKQSA